MNSESSWAYLPVLGALIQVTLTIALGGIMGALGVFDAEEFVTHAIRFVFYVALPCLVVRGIGIGVDFYSDKFLWMYIVAFLILRAVFLGLSLAVILFSNWSKKRPSRGLGDVAVLWLSLTWISTVIMGVPISTAVFGEPNKGQFYGLLAGISSFIFQLPLQLMFLECHSLKKSRRRNSEEILAPSIPPLDEMSETTTAGADEEVVEWGKQSTEESALESGLKACKAGQVPMSSGKDKPRDLDEESSEASKWWSLPGSEYIWNADLWVKIITRLLRNPLLWGIFWGFVLSLSTAGKYLRCPTGSDCIEGLGWINSILSWFGACVSPVSLFAMGLWMHSQGLRRIFRISVGRLTLFMFSKLVLVPLIMVGLAKGLNLTDEAGRAAVLIATLPISLASFSLGHQYQIGEADLAANVTAGTMLMLPTVIIWNLVMDKVGLFPIETHTA